MKITVDNVLDLMKGRYSPRNGQEMLHIGELAVGSIVRRGKRVGSSQKLTTEWMFRRNPSIGIDTELFASTQSALMRKIATAVARHVRGGKLDPEKFRPRPEDQADEKSARFGM